MYTIIYYTIIIFHQFRTALILIETGEINLPSLVGHLHMRNLELPGRSTVHCKNGMAATSHAIATSTAISILQNGGNAMDAAVGACAVQCVVEPESTGIGGDCFCIYSPEGSNNLVAF